MKVLLLAVILSASGCVARDPLTRYKIEDPNDEWALSDLPSILPSSELRDGTFEVANTEEWFRQTSANNLVEKGIEDAIALLGQNYLISLAWGRKEPHMYYSLAGTYSWDVFGVLVLDEDLTITRITLDPD